jgi:hypothetical protein
MRATAGSCFFHWAAARVCDPQFLVDLRAQAFRVARLGETVGIRPISRLVSCGRGFQGWVPIGARVSTAESQ